MKIHTHTSPETTERKPRKREIRERRQQKNHWRISERIFKALSG